MPNAICLHEEDYGILWKHVDLVSGRTEVRRSRRLVVSSIATVGNYEYGFFWYFYLDGSIQFEVKLTGILSTMAVAGDEAALTPAWWPPSWPRRSTSTSSTCAWTWRSTGPTTRSTRWTRRRRRPGEDNPWSNAFEPMATLLESELAARRNVDPSRSRSWKIVNRSRRNGLGQPTAYKLVPGSTPTLLADPDSSVGRRAAFARPQPVGHPVRADERRAAGDYPNQHAGGAGLPAWTARDRSMVDEDIVLWYTFGVTHIPRPEDWPVMPVEYTGFSLVPVGFFDRNPALDVPPTADGDHCHA